MFFAMFIVDFYILINTKYDPNTAIRLCQKQRSDSVFCSLKIREPSESREPKKSISMGQIQPTGHQPTSGQIQPAGTQFRPDPAYRTPVYLRADPACRYTVQNRSSLQDTSLSQGRSYLQVHS
jgi:hypothetical protein